MKKTLRTILLNKEAHAKFTADRKELFYKKHPEYAYRNTPEKLAKAIEWVWRNTHKETIDGVEYAFVVDDKDWNPKEEVQIAEKYGIEIYREWEWFNL